MGVSKGKNHGARQRVGIAALLTSALVISSPAPLAAARDHFPRVEPEDRLQALDVAVGAVSLPVRCASARVQELWNERRESRPATDGVLSLLQHEAPFAQNERRLRLPNGTIVRYSRDENAIDRLDPTDEDSDGLPDVLQAALIGLDEARQLLQGRLGLAEPDPFEIVLVELGADIDGYAVAADRPEMPTRMVLDVSPADGLDGLRRAAVHQYAHSVALAMQPRFSAEWAEALATWAALAVDGTPDATTRDLMSSRLGRLAEGLDVAAHDLAAGNALWFAFLDEAYGALAVRLTVEELGRGGPPLAALDRAVRRASDDDLTESFREFHLWSLLVGSDSDAFHFSFAEFLARPGFASGAAGLPALSVLSDPPVARMGAARVLLQPDGAEGGLSVHFEGEFGGDWNLDLILLREDGTKHRLGVPLSDGRGAISVPLGDLSAVWMLIRNVDGENGVPRRYTYAAHREPDFPFRIESLDASVVERPGSGVLLSWGTLSERELVGFNVLREREESGTVTVVNPVWIPALGDSAVSTAYRYLDSTAEPGASYVYRIQGITTEGLTALSDPLAIRRPADPR